MQKINIIEKISLYSFLTTVFLLPIFFIPGLSFSLGVSKGFFLFLGILISLLFWLLSKLVDGKIIVPKNLIFLGVIAIVLSVLVASVFSSNFTVSFWGNGFEIGTFISVFILAISFFLASVFFQKEKIAMYALGGFLLSIVVAGLFQVANVFSGIFNKLPFIFSNTQEGNIVGSFNDFAILAGLSIILSLVAVELLSLTKKWNVLFVLNILLNLFILLLIKYQTVWLVLSISSLILLVYKFSYIKTGTNKKSGNLIRGGKIPIFSTAIFVFSLICFLGGGNFVTNYFNVNNVDVRPSFGSTFNITKETLKESPIVGVGPNRFVNSWIKFKDSSINNTSFWNSNFNFSFGNIPTFATTTGALGILSWLFFLFLICRLFSKSFSVIMKNDFENTLILGTLVASVYFWIFGIVYASGIVVFAMAFICTGTLLGLLMSAKILKSSSFIFIKDPRLSFFAMLSIVVAMSLVGYVGYVTAKKSISIVYLQKATNTIKKNQDFDKANDFLSKAVSLQESDLYYRALVDIQMAKLNITLSDKDSQPSPEDLQKTLTIIQDNANKAISFDETNFTNWLTLAFVYDKLVSLGVSGAYENAIDAYNKAMEINSKNPFIDFSLAKLEFIHGDIQKSKDNLEKALNKKKNYTDVFILRSVIYAREGDLEKAITDINTALYYEPKNQDALSVLVQLKEKKTELETKIIPEPLVEESANPTN